MTALFHCLRPYVRPLVQRSHGANSSYLHFYKACKGPLGAQSPRSRPSLRLDARSIITDASSSAQGIGLPDTTTEQSARIRMSTSEQQPFPEQWPRMPSQENAMDCRSFRHQFTRVNTGVTRSEHVVVRGKIVTIS